MYLNSNGYQTLSFSGTQLSISNGNNLDLASLNTDTQTLTLSGNTLYISNGNNIDLSPYLGDTNTDNQTLSLSGDTLTISGGTGSIDLSTYLDNTDEQALSLSGNTLAISGTGSQVDLGNYKQTLTLSGTTLLISNGNSVDLSMYLNSNGYQTLSFSGTQLSISNGNNLDLASLNSDTQTLTLSGNILTISNGNTVDLSSYLDNTDSQTLSLSGSELSISGSTGSVDLSSIFQSYEHIFIQGDSSIQYGQGIEDMDYAHGSQADISIIPIVSTSGDISRNSNNQVVIGSDGTYKVSAIISVKDNGGSATVLFGAIGKNGIQLSSVHKDSAAM